MLVAMHTLLGVTLLVALAAAACPKQCRCIDTAINLIFEVQCRNTSLTEVPTGPHLQEVFFVDLSFNDITTLKNNTFFDGQMVKLLRLYLNNNGLKTIEEDAFRGLTQLKLLNLEMNDIVALLPNVLEDSVKLEVLNLNGNRHLLLPDTGLHLPYLDILLLKDCGLKSIPAQFFKKMLNLQYIFLSANELSVFDPHLISHLTQLKKLDLRDNKFTTLQFDLHEHLPETLVIDFDGNPLHCDCELESIYSLNKEKKLYDFLTCATPKNISLHKFLLESCGDTTMAASLVVTSLTNISTSPASVLDTSSSSSYESTTQSSSHVIVPEGDDGVNDAGSSDRSDAVSDMDGYTSWIVLSAVVLALVIIAVITVVVKRQKKTRDYDTPRRFKLLEYDDEEQSYVT